MTEKYSFVEQSGKSYTAIKIDSGEFSGIIFVYGRIGFSPEENADGTIDMTFDHQVLYNKENRDLGPPFIDVIGGILVKILEEHFDASSGSEIMPILNDESALSSFPGPGDL